MPQGRSRLLLILTLPLFYCSALGFGGIWLFKTIPAALGVDMSKKLSPEGFLVFLGTCLVVIPVLTYGGSIVWLLFARYCCNCTRVDVEPIVMRHRPRRGLNRFDDWLLDRIFPTG